MHSLKQDRFMSSEDRNTAPTAAILIIGNEILSGRTQDSSVAWIAGRLVEHGVRVREARVVPDIEAEIVAAAQALSARYDYLFTTGGIGPTHDDITTDCIAKAFGVPVVLDQEAARRLEDRYGPGTVSDARLRMARIPQGALLIDNPVSAAPGFQIGNVFVMAGVPAVMRAMLDGVLPALRGGPKLLQRTVVCQVPESVLAEPLGAIQAGHRDIDIGSYPWFRQGKSGVSLVARGTDSQSLDALAAEIAQMIRDLGGKPAMED
jgi:molybdenum cofactor synthesis domain-containing protein